MNFYKSIQLLIEDDACGKLIISGDFETPRKLIISKGRYQSKNSFEKHVVAVALLPFQYFMFIPSLFARAVIK